MDPKDSENKAFRPPRRIVWEIPTQTTTEGESSQESVEMSVVHPYNAGSSEIQFESNSDLETRTSEDTLRNEERDLHMKCNGKRLQVIGPAIVRASLNHPISNIADN